ncbi:MAG: tetraacyldisaccharide 4'-kinase [Bacteroidales bacterium]|nr:tetraacyldisaccharide 4'-kinase [Bacteroidales bacterium]
MIDKVLLFPYYLILGIRHALYNKGFLCKTREAAVPTICIGNITAGGTGKTPHTEMLLRTLHRSDDWGFRNVAVLSRGYKRKSKRFQQVMPGDSATVYGDEPVQIKKKFPAVTVAVDKDRIEGCDFLCNPEKLQTSKKARKCVHKEMEPAELIVLDDAFQYRKLKAAYNIVLVDYNRPLNKDMLLPLGRLRDLPSRLRAADAVIVTKCPHYMEDEEKAEFLSGLGYDDYDPLACEATNRKGGRQKVYFTCINYQPLEQIYEEGDTRYIYAKKLILFTGIAKDTPLRMFLSDKYKIVKHLSFSDHHNYTRADVRSFEAASRAFPTAAIATTEKDAQRLVDCPKVTPRLKERLFQVPIEVAFLSELEEAVFTSTLIEYLRKYQQQKHVE